jgi:hypothetical protein
MLRDYATKRCPHPDPLRHHTLLTRVAWRQVETIGDAFMCAGGVPDAMTGIAGACAAADMALDMIEVSAGRWFANQLTHCWTPTDDVLTGCCRGHAEHAPFRHLGRPGA